MPCTKGDVALHDYVFWNRDLTQENLVAMSIIFMS